MRRILAVVRARRGVAWIGAVSLVAGLGVAAVPGDSGAVVASSSVDALLGVACPSADTCFAVGGFAKPTVERWNGTAWVIQATPNLPVAGSQADLAGIACPGRQLCVAVGTAGSGIGPGSTIVIERWNGLVWKLDSASPPAGASGGGLTSVACSAATACMAVGAVFVGGYTVPIAEHWDGTRWTAQALPLPPASANGWVQSVACPSTTQCFAVGNPPGDPVDKVVEHWNGTSWTRATPPSGSYLTLYSIACPSTTTCVVVASNGGPVAEHWNGTSWLARPLPGGGQAVTCLSPTNCTSVGGMQTPQLAAHWNGKKWAAQLNTITSASGAGLSAVACINVSNCNAVGPAWGAGPLAEHWDGTRWKQQSTQ